jgi:hypothetical protein
MTDKTTPADPIAWARPRFQLCVDDVHELDRILHLSIEGFDKITKMPILTKALYNLDEATKTPTDPKTKKTIEQTDAMAKFAEAEMKNDFPSLHAHTVVSLWGSLDALVFDLATLRLIHHPETLKDEKLGKLKIPLADYETLTKEERMEFLVRELARSVNADFKTGLGKFEVILDAIGLGGAVSPELKKTLLELSQVRNVIVHRAGVADSRFAKTCPWFGVKSGEKVRIDHKTYKKYSDASHEYIFCLINRVRVKAGLGEYIPPKKKEVPPNHSHERPGASEAMP